MLTIISAKKLLFSIDFSKKIDMYRESYNKPRIFSKIL